MAHLYMKSRRWTHRWWTNETIKQGKTYEVYYHTVQELELDWSFRTFLSIFSDDKGAVRSYPVSDWAVTSWVNRARETFCYRAYVWGGCSWITGKDLGGYIGESIKWRHGRLAWCVLTAPGAVNTRARNEYASRITCMWSKSFYFQWFRWTRFTHHAYVESWLDAWSVKRDAWGAEIFL